MPRNSGTEGQFDGGLVSSADVRLEYEAARKRRRRWPWVVVFVAALVTFIVSLVAIGLIAFSYQQGQQRYDEIAETAHFDPPAEEEQDVDVKELTVDWKALKKANPDTVGWVFIPGTSINYPIVQGKDNEYYLSHDFDGEAGWLAEYGSIFLDHSNNPAWTDHLNFIYGHHMNDGSMFADISAMSDQSRFDASRIAYVLTPRGNFKLRSFSVVHCAADEEIVLASFDSRKEMQRYIQDKIDRSVVDAGKIPDAADIDRLFAFATCDNYSGGRYIMYAYILDTSVEDLSGEIGVKEKDGEAAGFVEELETD